jgi:hypothetical protein
MHITTRTAWLKKRRRSTVTVMTWETSEQSTDRVKKKVSPFNSRATLKRKSILVIRECNAINMAALF